MTKQWDEFDSADAHVLETRRATTDSDIFDGGHGWISSADPPEEFVVGDEGDEAEQSDGERSRFLLSLTVTMYALLAVSGIYLAYLAAAS